MAARLGKPYMPWQQAAADLAGEVDHRGRLVYREIVITVPRQSGKTTLILSVVVGRAEAGEAFGGRQRMLYAAQTREDARDKWKEDYLEELDSCRAMRGRYTKRIANGSEKVTFHKSRSTFGPIATKESSGHGKVLDFGCLDEAFAQTDNSVENAWNPAMITRPQAQMWIPSTAGTAESTYFRQKVDGGRLMAEAEITEGSAYIEYSAPDGADFESPDVWRRCMPALGYTQDIESIRRELIRMRSTPGGIAGFKRAYLNIWVDRITDQVLPVDKWNACLNADAERQTRPVLVIDVSADRKHTSVAMGAATTDAEGRTVPLVRLVDYRPGTGWVVDRILELRDQYDVAKVIVDGAGPAGSLVADLEREYIDLHVMTAHNMVAACGGFYDAVQQGQLAHFGEPALELAVTGAEKRELGDAWAWTRKKSHEQTRTDISPLVAVTSAHWGQLVYGDDPGFDLSSSFG